MGIPAQHEPPNTQELRINAEVFTIFEATGWTKFFQCLNGFHREIALQFSLNLTETHSEVRGLHIEVSEAIVAEVTAFLGWEEPGLVKEPPMLLQYKIF